MGLATVLILALGIALIFWQRARHQAEYLQAFIDAEYDTLSSLVKNHPLATKLADICALVERQIPGCYASVLIADPQGRTLNAIAVKSLPTYYTDALQNIPITVGEGACGSAAALREPVIITDTQHDPRFHDYRELITELNLNAAWSYPVFSPFDRRLLATFALYSVQSRDPTPEEERLITRSCDLISLVIAQHQERYERLWSEQQTRSLFQHNPEAAFTLDLDGTIISANHASGKLVDMPLSEIAGQHYELFLMEDDKERAGRHFAAAKRGEPQHYTVRVVDSHGAMKRLEITNIPMIIDGEIVGVYGISKDITQQSEVEERLQILNRSVEASTNGIVICDARADDYPIIYTNPAFTAITGYTFAEVEGRNMRLLHGPETDPKTIDKIYLALEKQREIRCVIRNYRKTGEAFWNELFISPVSDSRGVITHFVGLHNDISERVEREAELAYNAAHDVLTGLPNRTSLERFLQQAMSADTDQRIYVLFIDLDGFKPVNDSLGHESGDLVLVETAARIRRVVPAADMLARFGGDEFVAVIQTAADDDTVVQLAQTILQQFERPFCNGDAEVSLSAAVGIASSAIAVNKPVELVQYADVAMYEAKRRGSNTYQWFTPDLEADSQQQLMLRSQLQEAIQKHQFRVFYQPIVSPDKTVVAVEALVRWLHPERGWMAPNDFIPLAERTGQIVPIGTWVLEQVCRDMPQLRAAGVPHISVNFSPMQFYRDDFIETVTGYVEQYGIAPGELTAEITENVLLRDANHAIRMMNELRKLGLAIALDDFGTGFTSLSYLNMIPAQKLKLDREFVHQIHQNPRNGAITRGILAIAAELDITVIAEGVESPAELDYLQSYGCNYLQGYLFCEPLALTDLLVWLDHK